MNDYYNVAWGFSNPSSPYTVLEALTFKLAGFHVGTLSNLTVKSTDAASFPHVSLTLEPVGSHFEIAEEPTI